MGLKRGLPEQAVRIDPAPEEFEHWLLGQCQTRGTAAGPLRAMAQEILAEWRLAESSAAFRTWISRGAPFDNSATPERTA